MKKLWLALLLVVTIVTVSLAAEKVEAPESCKHCGMDRTKFAHSRMVVTYADGSSVGTCSINCVVTELKDNKKKVKSFQVGDYNSKKLIDAKTATWVIGGSMKGVMTKTAKWAFATKGDAEKFIASYGGNLASFDDAMKAAEKEQGNKTHDHKKHDHKM